MLKVTDKVIKYNTFNKDHDYTYMYSDNSRVYNKGEKESKQLQELFKNLTLEERDLVGLYNNHILKRKDKYSKGYLVVNLPDTPEEAYRYYGKS